MAVKTITIDMEAYGALSRHKKPGQSFSEVIKAHFGPQPTAGRFLKLVKTIKLSPETLDAVDELIKDRKRWRARAIRWDIDDDAASR